MQLSRLFPFCRGQLRLLSLRLTIVSIMLYTNGFVSTWTVGGDGACNIKGNVGVSGELIYHLPGGGYYDRPRVSGTKGDWTWNSTHRDQFPAVFARPRASPNWMKSD